MHPLLIVGGLGAAALGALALTKKKDESKPAAALVNRTGGGGLDLSAKTSASVPNLGVPSNTAPLPRIPAIPTPKGSTSFPPGAELAIVTADPGIMTRMGPSPTATPIAPQGMPPNDAFKGSTVAVIQRGFPETGALAGARMEWWKIMTPSGGTGYVRAVGPNGEKNLGLTGQRIPGGSSPQVQIEPPAPAPYPLPTPPTPEDLAKKYPAPIPTPEDLEDLQNLIKPVKLDIPTSSKGIVRSSNGLNTRTGPGTSYGLVPKNDAWNGTTVTILEKGLGKSPGSMAEWWKIITPGGSTGFTQAIDPNGKYLIEASGGAVSA
jgi:hypothetical protein